MKELRKYFYRSDFFVKPANDLHPHQLFADVQFEEARDELRQGLYPPSPFHSPFPLPHNGCIAHSPQQQINYENAEITKLIQSDEKMRETVERIIWTNPIQTVSCDFAYIL